MLAEFQIGDQIRHISILRVQKMGTSSNGGVFVRGTLQDNSGTLNFISFNKDVAEVLKEEQGVSVWVVFGQTQADRYSGEGAKQLLIDKLELPQDYEDLSHLLPYTPKDIPQYQERLQSLIEGIFKPHIKELLKYIFSGDTFKKFSQNPAAMTHHHAYIGGLLEHSIDVAFLAKKIAGEYQSVDDDLIVAGALLHDVGKIKEISPQIGFEYTETGRYIGHIALGSFMLEKALAQVKNFPKEDALEIMHILLSHHGCLENGSPVAPATKEALIVHYADDLDSKLNQMEQLARNDKIGWQFSKMLGRQIKIKR